MARAPRSAVRGVKNSAPGRAAARLGYVVNGIVNVAIGILAMGVAGTGASGNADPGGAMAGIAAAPGGRILIWVVAVGMAGLAFWQIASAIQERRGHNRRVMLLRAKFVGKAVAYLALAVLAIRVAIQGAAGGGAEQSAAAGALAAPGGVILVVLAGLLALGVGGYLIIKGVRRTFLDDLERQTGTQRTAITLIGVIGYVARGLAIAVIGILFLVAAATADPSRAGGLDAALSALAALPFGQVLLVAVGVGFIAYGLYSAVRARYAKL